jgi:arylsulfatase A-like enzyme
MKTSSAPLRRRALTAATAALTAVATLGAMGVITAMGSTPSQASTSVIAGATQPADSLAAATTIAPAADTPAPTDVTSDPSDPAVTPPATPAATGSIADITNVVFVLADDLDWALFDQIPRLAALKSEGMTFTNHTVTDSLCCPSRTSILRSQYIHNHKVVSNIAETGGGWPTFKALGEQRDCLPVWLSSAGVSTALFGKYLNDYAVDTHKDRAVPPGWDKWAVPMSGSDTYSGYNYTLNENGRLRSYGKKPAEFLNDVITSKAVSFIRTAPDGFFLELSTYNPHKPAPVAVRNKATHLAEVAPRTPAYNAYGTNEPTWMRKLTPISMWKQERLDELWRQRAQSAESVADSVDAVRAELVATGRSANTLIVVTSDNGYHAGAHRMRQGKRTAFHEDTVVPMIVIGPGITPGSRIDAMTSTIDLAPTFTDVLGATAPAWIDGRSLTGILATGTVPADWRTAALSESMGRSTPADPDYQKDAPPQFTSLRTQRWLFVVYRDGERELYDLAADPNEMNNIVASADPALVTGLYSQMQALRACSGPSCRTADAIVVESTAPVAPVPPVPVVPSPPVQ